MVSNDNYRELINEKQEFKKVIEERILMYTFVDDRYPMLQIKNEKFVQFLFLYLSLNQSFLGLSKIENVKKKAYFCIFFFLKQIQTIY